MSILQLNKYLCPLGKPVFQIDSQAAQKGCIRFMVAVGFDIIVVKIFISKTQASPISNLPGPRLIPLNRDSSPSASACRDGIPH